MSAPIPWQPLRLDDFTLPEALGGVHGTVALVAHRDVVERGWAAQAAGALARTWARSGVPTVLFDLDFETPELHTAMGVPNDEGVSDVLAFGVSPRRVAHRLGERLFLAPAGAPSADGAALRASPRWDALVEGFEEAGAALLLYVPADADGIEAVLARAETVIVLAPPHASLRLGEAQERLSAVLGPEDEAEARMFEPKAFAGSDSKSDDAPQTPTRRRRPDPIAKDTGGGRGCGRLIVIGVVIVVLVLVMVAIMGWANRADSVTESAVAVAPEPGPVSPPAIAEVSAPSAVVSPIQAWAVAREAHESLEEASARVSMLRERLPDLVFWVAPVRVREELFFRVMVGPAQDADAARALGEVLVPGGVPGEDWVPREAGLSYLLGEEADRVDAWNRTIALDAQGVPTHLLQVARTDGSTAYRIYAGSYASAGEAEAMAALLSSSGLETAPLTDRRGVPVR